jgi:hypothetical protein
LGFMGSGTRKDLTIPQSLTLYWVSYGLGVDCGC